MVGVAHSGTQQEDIAAANAIPEVFRDMLRRTGLHDDQLVEFMVMNDFRLLIILFVQNDDSGFQIVEKMFFRYMVDVFRMLIHHGSLSDFSFLSLI